MARGQAELVTTFEVDANGLLKVTAQDRASGRKAQISGNPRIYPQKQITDVEVGLRHHELRRSPLFCRDRADGKGCGAIQAG